jgi:phosphoribosylaminoimidazolecarboxamide formyltransferase / IMP cyclohydrolase
MSRVDASRIAARKAQDAATDAKLAEPMTRGSVVASDAFFPFADGLQVLIDAGVRAVVEPGGSIHDDEVVEAARAAGITLYFTGTRHFFH